MTAIRQQNQEEDENGSHVIWRICNARHRVLKGYLAFVGLVALAILALFGTVMQGQATIANKAEEAVRISTVASERNNQDRTYIKENVREIKNDIKEINKRQNDTNVELKILIQKVIDK